MGRLGVRLQWAVVLCACASQGSGDDGGSSSSGTAAMVTEGSSGSSTAHAVDSSSSSMGADSTTQAPPGTSSSGSESTAGNDLCQTAGGPDPDFAQSEGRFALRVLPGYVGFTGGVTDGPRLDFHHETERSGMCRLLRFTPSVCSPACVAPAACVEGACVTHPLQRSVGDITLEGIGLDPVVVLEDDLHNYFWDHTGDPAVTMPRISTADGSEVPFDLSVCPIEGPTPTGDWSAQLEARQPGQSVVLSWSDPVETSRIYLRMTTGIGTHGGISPVEVECEGPDVGMLEIPGSYLDALYAQGWGCGECGGNDLIRYHGAKTTGEAPIVEFRAQGVTSFWHIPFG